MATAPKEDRIRAEMHSEHDDQRLHALHLSERPAPRLLYHATTFLAGFARSTTDQSSLLPLLPTTFYRSKGCEISRGAAALLG